MYNIVVDKSGEIISAGFCDFSSQLKDGEIVAQSKGHIPHDIGTHWIYNFDAQKLEQRKIPLEPLITRFQKEEEQRKRGEYSKCRTQGEKIAFFEKQMGLKQTT